MSLQTKVFIDVALAVPGQKATPDQSVYTPINYVADAAGVQAGTFCWASATAGVATATTTGTDAPLGFVERVVSTFLYNALDSATMTIPEGQGLSVAVRGDYYVEASETAAVGGQVFVDKTNGKILAAAGENGIAAPGWVFKTAGVAGDMVIISNWSVAAANAANLENS